MFRRHLLPLLMALAAFCAAVSARAQSRLATGTPLMERYQPPELNPRRRDLPLAILFALENDNLLLGAWHWTGMDGRDVGRTHGTLLQFSHVFDDGVSATLQVDTTLFTRRDGTMEGRLTGQVFNEENNFRLVVDSLLQGEGLYWSAGAGVSVLNGETVTVGATGQQDMYHAFLFDVLGRDRRYAYHPDGRGIRAGAFAEGGIGLFGTLLRDPMATLALQGQVMARFSSLWAGSGILSATALALMLGRRDGAGNPILRLEGIAEINQYLESAGPELVARVRAALTGDWGEFFGALNWYGGDPANEYRIYNFNNVTMTLGIAVLAQ